MATTTGDGRATSALDHRPIARAEIEQPLHARFAEQVARFPDRPAIRTARHSWTYAELSGHVDAMATALLRRSGAEKGRVALLFDHGAPMCAAVLAALRAGKAYVPLDPGYPRQRLEAMLQDSGAEAVLAERAQAGLAEQLTGGAIPVVIAEDAGGRAARFPAVEPSDLAYILYTSGSTGRPKGVVQNQRNVLHFIRAYTNNLLLSPADRLTLLSSYSFDAAVMATYGALLNGACLFPRSVREGGFRDLGRWVRDSQISVYHSTPTVYRHFLAASAAGERFETVWRVVLGGEPVVRRDAEAFKTFFPRGAVMVNGLGPTESTVTLQHFVDHDTELEGHAVPVGRPVCDTSVVLVDDAGRESATEGEITFVSDHLAIGYWRRPDLDAKAFATHPTEAGPRRCYRTGDLGRWRPDGTLEFLGRKDFQVKIHGVRVELPEVEGAVEQQPGVAQCIAMARPGADGEVRLVVYVRRAPGAELDPSRTREGVRALLPDAMVPSLVFVLDDFPMTPTGKIDRLALPDLVAAAPAETTAGSALASDTERRLAEVWCTILGRPQVGPEEDFFSVGGDSLGALRLADEIARVFSVQVALGRLFQLRTVRALAEALDRGEDLGRSDAGVVPLRGGTPDGAHLFCICGIQLYQALADAIGSAHRVSGVFLPVEERVLSGAPLPGVPEVAAMYREVVRAAQPRGPYRLAGVSFGGMLAFELARQLRSEGESVDFLAVFDTALPQTIGRRDRIRAHARLALRHGPGYVVEKVAGKSRGLLARLHASRPRQPGTGGSEREDPIAIRDRVYTNALDAYRRAMPRYDGELHFFRAADGGEFDREAVPLDYNWSRFAERCHAHEVPGGHLGILAAPGVERIGAFVRRALDASAGTAASEGGADVGGRGQRRSTASAAT